MKVSVVGARGRIGSTLRKKLSENGHKIIYEAEKGDSLDTSMLMGSDAVLLAVPEGEALKLIEDLGDSCTLIELSSVKSEMKKFSGRVISIHPMFGPQSAENNDFRTILFINDISPNGSIGIIKSLFPQNSLVEVTAEEHDVSMAELLVAPYVMSMLAASIVRAVPGYSSPSHANLERFASALEGENMAVVWDTIARNIFSRAVIDRILNEIVKLRGELN